MKLFVFLCVSTIDCNTNRYLKEFFHIQSNDIVPHWIRHGDAIPNQQDTVNYHLSMLLNMSAPQLKNFIFILVSEMNEWQISNGECNIPVLSVPATSGQACRFNNNRLSSVQLSIFDTGFLHSPCPRLYVNVNGPTKNNLMPVSDFNAI